MPTLIINFVHTVFFSFAAFTFMFVSIGIMIYLKFKRFNSHNPPPGVYGIPPNLQKETAKVPPTVQCGLYINEFSEFSIINNNFVADIFLWFVFHPSHIDKDIVENFTIEKGTILSKDKRETKFIGDRLFVQYKVRVRFSSSLNFKDFPFDDHRLYLTLLNDNLTPDELHFKGSELAMRVNPDLNISGWRLTNVDVKAGFKSAELDKRRHEEISYPCITFSMDFKRKGIRQALIVILPMLGMFFISYISLTFSFQEVVPRLHVIAFNLGSITGLLAYRFVLETISPRVGYFTITDHIFFMFLTAVFIIFLLKLYIAMMVPDLIIFKIINTLGVIMVPLAVLAAFFVLLNSDKLFWRKK